MKAEAGAALDSVPACRMLPRHAWHGLHAGRRRRHGSRLPPGGVVPVWLQLLLLLLLLRRLLGQR